MIVLAICVFDELVFDLLEQWWDWLWAMGDLWILSSIMLYLNQTLSLSLSLILCFVARKISFLRNQTENIYTC